MQIDISERFDQPVDLVFAMVNDVEKYPEFLPRISNVSRHDYKSGMESESYIAAVQMDLGFVQLHYKTRNHVHFSQKKISLTYISGPFRHLTGTWHFTPQPKAATRVELQMSWAFSSGLLAAVANRSLQIILTEAVSSFKSRAEFLDRRIKNG